MSDLLVDLSSSAVDAAAAGFTDVVGLFETVTVGSSDSVILMIATIQGTIATGSAEEASEIRFAVDDTLEGPEVAMFKDNADELCGNSLCYVRTGLSGSTKFALQWRNRLGTADVDTNLVRTLKVIEITDASILVNQTSSAADDAVTGYTDIVDLSDTQTPDSSNSILLLLANIQTIEGAADNLHAMTFNIGGTREGPECTTFVDNLNDLCGNSIMWAKTGVSGSTAFSAQWDELNGAVAADTTRVRSFQVVDITANANLLTNVTSVAADVLTSSYTDVVDLVDTVTVDSTDSILIFGAIALPKAANDSVGKYRFFESSTGEGAEVFSFSDAVSPNDQMCGHSVYHAVNGKSAGSHTFSLRGLNHKSTVNISEAHRRSLIILELTVAAALADYPDQIFEEDAGISYGQVPTSS